MENITSNKGADKIIYNGIIYRKTTTNITTQSWRCEISRCKRSASTSVHYLDDGKVIEKEPHKHPPDTARTEFASSLYQALNSATTLQLPPRRIISEIRQSTEAKAMAPNRKAITEKLKKTKKN